MHEHMNKLLPSSIISPVAMCGSTIFILSCLVAYFASVSKIVKNSVPSNFLSLTIGIVKFTTVLPGMKVTTSLSAKSTPPMSDHTKVYDTFN